MTEFDWSDIKDEEVSTPPRTTSRTGTGKARGRRPAKARLEELQQQLSQQMFMAGAMVGLGLPVTGYYACQESDTFTKAIVQLASHRKEWVEALEHLANIQPGLIVGRTALGLGAAIAVDRERANPENQFMRFLGVHAAWYAVQNPEMGGPEEGSGYSPPPGNFVPIT